MPQILLVNCLPPPLPFETDLIPSQNMHKSLINFWGQLGSLPYRFFHLQAKKLSRQFSAKKLLICATKQGIRPDSHYLPHSLTWITRWHGWLPTALHCVCNLESETLVAISPKSPGTSNWIWQDETFMIGVNKCSICVKDTFKVNVVQGKRLDSDKVFGPHAFSIKSCTWL